MSGPIHIAIPIVSVLFIYLLRMKELATKRPVTRGVIKEKATFYLFMLSGFVALGGGLLEYYLRGLNWSWPFLIAGWLVAVTSFAVRWAAIKALGKFWSLHNEVRDNHEFVQTGPFRWVRHPTYFSMILEVLAGGLILGSPMASVLAMMMLISALFVRIRAEESSLLANIGDAYEIYRQNTPAIIPFLKGLPS